MILYLAGLNGFGGREQIGGIIDDHSVLSGNARRSILIRGGAG